MQRERDIQKSRGGGRGTAVIAIVADVIGEAHGSPVILPDAFHCAGGVDLSCTDLLCGPFGGLAGPVRFFRDYQGLWGPFWDYPPASENGQNSLILQENQAPSR